jgi:hypothetical protein
MKTKLLVLGLLLACFAAPLTQGEEKQPAKEVAPQHGIWKLEMDDKVDGTLDPNTTSTHDFKISVVNNRLVGTNSHPDWTKVGHMTGEITPGDPAIIYIRQDGTGRKGEVRYFCGTMVKEGVFEGTYYQSQGGSGDFRLTLSSAE